MEASSAETASVSELEGLLETSAFSHLPGQDPAAAGSAAGTAIMEEQDSEMVLVEEETKGLHLSSFKESAGQASIFPSLSFPQKLWVLAESENVKSVWWGLGGNRLVIEEELFLVEVLAKEGPVRAFDCTSMKSFVRQLNYYGFTKVTQAVERSPSLPEFLAEEEVFASNRKLLLYSSPFFRRHYPHLLQHCKRRAAWKRSAVAAPGPALQEAQNESPQKSSPGAQLTWGAAAGPERSLQAAEPASQAPQRRHPLSASRPCSQPARACRSTSAATVPGSALLHAATEQQPDAGCHLCSFGARRSALCGFHFDNWPRSEEAPAGPRNTPAAGSLGCPAFPLCMFCDGHDGSGQDDATGLAAMGSPTLPNMHLQPALGRCQP